MAVAISPPSDASQAHRQTGDATLKLLELADVDDRWLVAHGLQQRRRLRGAEDISNRPSPRSTTWAPGGSGTAMNFRKNERSSTNAWKADDGSVSQRGDRGLEVQCLRDRDGDNC